MAVNAESQTIAMLGLGAMGSRMAARLLERGHRVVVWNRTQAAASALIAKGALAAATPRAAAATADVVLVSVTDDDASRTVWLDEDGAVHGLRPGCVAVDVSTLTPAWVQSLAAQVRATGAAFVDAPVVGSRPQADAGTLTFLVGGRAGDVSMVSPILASIGAAVHHAGGIGDGARLKLAVNALFAVQVAAYAELTHWLSRDGLSPEAIAVIGTLPVMSAALQGPAQQIRSGSYTPLFPIALVEKDLRYVLQSATATGVSLGLAASAHAQYANAVTKGFGGDNIAGVAQVHD